METETPVHWLTIAKRINSIANTGLAFTKDQYDRERYEQLQKLSIEILHKITDIDTRKLEFVFNREIGYQTPKLGVRVVVIENDNILLVKEKMDNRWSLPGGYADTGLTPKEIAIKEAQEESGFIVHPVRMLALIDYNKYQQKPFPFDIYNLFIECEITGGEALPGEETSEVGFFDIHNLPELSERRVTKAQIFKMFELTKKKELNPVFD